MLAFVGTAATNAIYTMSITAAYAIPTLSQLALNNDFKPGAFNFGFFVSPHGMPPVLSYPAPTPIELKGFVTKILCP